MNLFKKALTLIIALSILSIISANAEEKLITDMLGRKIKITTPINRVLSTTPTTTILVYMIAPEKLGGWNFKPNGNLMNREYLGLPIVGGWFGKKSGNYETFIRMNPDILLEGFSNLGTLNIQTITERQKKMGLIPVIGVKDTADITGYESSIRFIGKILDREEWADKLANFYKSLLNKVTTGVSKIPVSDRVTVYYAEGTKGLFSETEKSVHASLITLCGGENVVKVTQRSSSSGKKGFGRVKVSIEEIINWNPQVIITMDSNFYKSVYTDPKWRFIKAVKNHRVYLSPRQPFGWFDRPPGINRIPGIIWTAHKLYPEIFKREEMKNLLIDFFRDFYHYTLSKQQVEDFLEK